MSAQGWSASDNLGQQSIKQNETLKGFRVWRTLSGLILKLIADPQGSRSSNPGLKLANAFGVKA
jgi:hypothetical protein